MANNKSISPISSKNPKCNNSFVKPSFLTNHKRLDPITHSNNPSDFSRRWSVERERDFDEKENENDQNLKASKLRSPSKNSKNFMSPTISAASKFVLPSPKKKILVERNDPLRTSISLCNGKATFFSSINASQDLDANSDIESDHNQTTVTSLDLKDANEADREGSFVSKPKKRVTFADFPLNYIPASESGVSESENSLKTELVLKNKVFSSPVSLRGASPSPDSSLRPYDPKTNYLSPRPQFLHYKPNPRIGILLNKEKLEDDYLEEIMCGAFSDSESTEESSQSEYSQTEESEFNDRYDLVNGIDETEEHTHVLESCNSSTDSDNLAHKREKKSRGYFKMACFSILLVFLIACVSVSVTRSDQFACSGMSFSDLNSYYHDFKVLASQKASLEKLARNVNEFSVNSFAFVSELIGKHGKAEKIGPVKFMNITDLQMSIWNEDHFQNNHIGMELVDDEHELLDDDLEQEDEGEEDLNAETYGFEQEVDSTDSSEMELVEDQEEDDELENGIAEIEEESLVRITADKDDDREIEEESLVNVTSDNKLSDLVMVITSESENSVFVEDKTDVIAHVNSEEITFQAETSRIVAEIAKCVETEDLEKASILDDENAVDSLISSEASQILLKNESPVGKMEKKLAHYIIGFSSLIGTLLGVAAVVYNLKRSNRPGNIVVETKPSSREQIRQESRISKILQQEVEEPCSSEMSSFNSAVYGKKVLRRNVETQSFEGKPRRYSKRESLASSSVEYGSQEDTGALSYGSFTTFERIPIGEDEIITPVRRSSRLRMQVTSP